MQHAWVLDDRLTGPRSLGPIETCLYIGVNPFGKAMIPEDRSSRTSPAFEIRTSVDSLPLVLFV